MAARGLAVRSISDALGKHGVGSMARYLRHFALVMVLEERGLTPGQMRSVIGISENLIEQYRALYTELNVPEYQRAIQRLQQGVYKPAKGVSETTGEADSSEKGGSV